MISLKSLPLSMKFGVSLIWDALDASIFRIPVIGTAADIAGTILNISLWGPLGIAYMWEILEASDQLDAEIPTMTITGLVVTILHGGK